MYGSGTHSENRAVSMEVWVRKDEEFLAMNVEKLSSRYPDGAFDVDYFSRDHGTMRGNVCTLDNYHQDPELSHSENPAEHKFAMNL